jgi:hypothetical protein
VGIDRINKQNPYKTFVNSVQLIENKEILQLTVAFLFRKAYDETIKNDCGGNKNG